MNAAGQLAVREDAALNLLKAKLGVPSASSPGTGSSSSPTLPPPQQQAVTDTFLLRFLRNKKLNVEETMEKLRRRREYERSLPTLGVSPTCVRALRSGAFCVLGVDVIRRPVLYVRMNVLRAVVESDEIEKLAIILLEYLQGIAITANPQQQEIVVVVGQQDSASWYQWQGSSLQNDALVTLLSKYYPDLVGLVLIVDAPWATRQRVKSALSAAQSSRARNMFQIVSKAELQRYMDVSILPEDLGGRHATESAHDFSESVMRFWYSTIALIQNEGASGASRPLYAPSPVVIGSSGSAGALSSSHFGRSGGSATNRSMQKVPSGLTPRRRAHSSLNATLNADSDDGRCSVISETDVEVDHNDNDDAFSDNDISPPSVGTKIEGGGGGGGGGGSDSKKLAVELRAERERRIALEHELTRLRLGITIDSSTVTKLEAALRQVHEELNVMIGEVIVKAKEGITTTPPTQQQRNQKSTSAPSGKAPSLHQLFEMTDSLLLKVVQERQPVGAMKFATPHADRLKERGGRCCLM